MNPGRIQKIDPPGGSVPYTIGVLEARLGGSTFWILGGFGKEDPKSITPKSGFEDSCGVD